MTSSVSGNVIECSCFRILAVSCGVWSADVHGRMPQSRAVVTRLVTHIGTRVETQGGQHHAQPTRPRHHLDLRRNRTQPDHAPGFVPGDTLSR
jgi:hypothetical protein